MAMMRDWKVRAFPELTALHLRPEGVGKSNVLRHGMRWGRRFYLVGYHPLFYFAHCIRRMGRRPAILGGTCQLLGFVVATLKAETRPVSPEFVRFHREIQMRRLFGMLPGAGASRQAQPKIFE